MEKLVVLTRERLSENQQWNDFFLVSTSNDPEKRIREVVREYLLTDEGAEDIKDSCEDYNWGDVLMTIPESFWNQYGIQTISDGDQITFSNPIVMVVNQDEILIPNEYYEREE